LTLADPKLTPLGIEQAEAIQDAWKTEAKYGLFPPHKGFTSPLTRALHTAFIISNDVFETYPDSIQVMEVSLSNLEAFQ
jgi:broad specificity phosphatase PhoE